MGARDFSERHQELTALAENPDAKRDLLEEKAWEVINGAVSDHFSDDVRLLPHTRSLLDRLASDEVPEKELQETDLDRPFNARITLASWEVILKTASGEPIDDGTRRYTRRKLGELMLETTEGNFNLDELSGWGAQKMSEVELLQLLLRNDQTTEIYGYPAAPRAHHMRSSERHTTGSSFHVYGIAPGRELPIFVRRFYHEHMIDSDRHPDVLPISLARVFYQCSTRVKTIQEESRLQGTPKERQRWLTNLAARTLTQEVMSEELGGPRRTAVNLLDLSTTYLNHFLQSFEPGNAGTYPI